MADANPDLDLGEAPAGAEEKKSGGNMMLIIIVAVAALALGAGAAWFMLPQSEPAAEGEEVAAEQSAEEGATEEQPAEALPEPIYYDLGQEFISNLQDYGFVRMKASVMSYDQMQVDKVNHNKAAILHEVLSLLRAHSYEQLSTTEGQETLRMSIKDKVQEIIRAGEGGGVEEVYLTDFILQKN
ncbi:flagellar basal body-associated FliL family protein [Porticoccus sp. W117]|uniref:flagellar basal body-associated FliL family protein n=1 Tax=Porticoccus sp. W117 TaxID=3054777 RepID=UPI002594AF5B|nr:flagellar basal body-associated FliL family protein [Porticoccus sp. W117]MDM3870984.1 flagellar basal body-associated FliL family protein [Porticoccus sp. W117]